LSQDTEYIPVLRAGGGAGLQLGNAAKWVTLIGALALLAIGGLTSWNWVHEHIFGIGVEDAGSTTVNQAVLIDRIHSFEMVTAKDTYDTSSNRDFHQRLNLGLTKFNLPGFVVGQELDVKAHVTVAAGVDLSQVGPEDLEIIQQDGGSVVVVRIPAAKVTSTEIDADTFNISTSKGLLNKLGSTVGLGGGDVRDGAVAAVTSLARDEAIREGLLTEAGAEARTRLQQFLQSLPQDQGSHVTYLVEFQAPPPQ
jgi:hypothetical protein